VSGRDLAMLGAGFAIWAAAFVALYAMLSVGCAFGWERFEIVSGLSLQRAQLLAILAVSLMAGAWLAARLRTRAGDPFLRRAAHLAAVAALGSSVFSFFPVYGLSTCT
jgi:hypothetical protein